ncbi:MAG: leucine-rich repeat domain-containing protein [Clostridia bacterium]|nr:leucine-rich repeat domain-containing protein [Clostridia bacterium]
MQRRWKRMCSLLLSVVIALSAFGGLSLTASANGTCGDHLTWTLANGTLTISGTGEMFNYGREDDAGGLAGDLPTNAPPWYYDREDITAVVLESNVTSIGARAFAYCSNLVSLSFSGNLTSIGKFAFGECVSLTAVTIPDSVTALGTGVFWGCTGITNLSIGSGVTMLPHSAFRGCTNLTSVTIPDNVTELENSVFFECTGLVRATLSSSQTGTGIAAFSNCTNLTRIDIPSGMTRIDRSSFSYCTSLTSVIIPNTVAEFDVGAFFGCENLTNVNIPLGTTSLGAGVFGDCFSLPNIHIPTAVQTIGSSAFSRCTSLAYICSPVENGAAQTYADANGIPFQCCAAEQCGDNLEWTIENQLLIIRGTGPMYDFDSANPAPWSSAAEGSFHRILIEDGVTRIGNNAFRDLGSIGRMVWNAHIPASVTSIGSGAFDGTTMMYICSTTTDCAAKAYAVAGGFTQYAPQSNEPFYLCAGQCGGNVHWRISHTEEDEERGLSYEILRISGAGPMCDYDAVSNPAPWNAIPYYDGYSAIVDDGVTYIGSGAFNRVYVFGVHIPASVQAFGSGVFSDQSRFPDFICSDTDTCAAAAYAAANGKKFYCCSGQCGDNVRWRFSLTGTLTISGTGAMYDYDWTSEVFAPWSVFGYYIWNIIVENGVTSIGDSAFPFCALTDIDLPETLVSIGNSAFEDCRDQNFLYIDLPGNLVSIGENAFIYCDNLQDVRFPPSITTIGRGAFFSCNNLTELSLPGVEYIGEDAFSTCNSLERVTFGPNLHTIGAFAFTDCDALGADGIHIPSSVISIECYAFDGCSQLAYLCAQDAGGAAAQHAAAYGIPFVLCTGHDDTPPLPPAPQDQMRASIDDRIRITFLLDLDARPDAREIGVRHESPDSETVLGTALFDRASLERDADGLYLVPVDVAPAQAADRYVVCIDGEEIAQNIYSVREYCTALIAGDYGAEIGALAQAMLEYAQAMLEYAQAANDVLGYTDTVIADLSGLQTDAVNACEAAFDDGTGAVTAMSFMALTKPEFRFYTAGISQSAAAAYNRAGVTAAYQNAALTENLNARFVKKANGSILIEVTGISAEHMDETILVTIAGLGMITFSGNVFAKMMANNAATAPLGAALYNYGAAAKACFVNA